MFLIKEKNIVVKKVKYPNNYLFMFAEHFDEPKRVYTEKNI